MWIAACGASGDKSGDNGLGGGDGSDSSTGHGDIGGSGDGFTLGDTSPKLDSSAPDYGDAFWAGDPPPASCGDSGVTPPLPGGTPDCPDDKNREGCPCPTEGVSAACWPGLRKNRNHGICKDGTTTCVRHEADLTWGPCSGYVLPTDPTGTGKAACTCFSGGTWAIANLSPCFIGSGSTYTGAVSTLPNYDGSGVAHPACTSDGSEPSVDWSTTTLKVDCAGHFKLCYTLKAGSATAPTPTDCVVTEQCAEGDYTTPNVVQKWGDLPHWSSTDAACASKFATSGGYGEMSVVGTSVECDTVNKVFNRVTYCALGSSDPSCGAGGGGSF
jgi:hypothetical protein